MSDWKEQAAKRRDKRNIKEPETNKPQPSKKDTRKWCKGKVGKEHQMKVIRYSDIHKWSLNKKAKILFCSVCGKELDIYWGGKNKPEWAK